MTKEECKKALEITVKVLLGYKATEEEYELMKRYEKYINS